MCKVRVCVDSKSKHVDIHMRFTISLIGMAFLAAMLLIHFEDYEAFSCFANLLVRATCRCCRTPRLFVSF